MCCSPWSRKELDMTKRLTGTDSVTECNFLFPTHSKAGKPKVWCLKQRKVYHRAKKGGQVAHAQTPELPDGFLGEHFFFFSFQFYLFIYFSLYNIVLVLPYTDMNLPWVYMSSQT